MEILQEFLIEVTIILVAMIIFLIIILLDVAKSLGKLEARTKYQSYKLNSLEDQLRINNPKP